MKIEVGPALLAWLPAFGLPPDPGPGVKDLRGQRIRVSRFHDEAVLQFFFPKRTIPFHATIVRALTARLRQRGAKIDTVVPTPEDYARWLDSERLEDTPERRYQFASRPPPIA